jgi:hypothetical protein
LEVKLEYMILDHLTQIQMHMKLMHYQLEHNFQAHLINIHMDNHLE